MAERPGTSGIGMALPVIIGGLFLGSSHHGGLAAEAFAIDRSLVEVRSSDALPKEVNEMLGRWKPGPAGMADSYQPFNKTEVVDPNLPTRRFMSAGSNLHAVLVAYEQGGQTLSFFAIAFSLEPSGWRQVRSWTLPSSAYSFNKLMDFVAPPKSDSTTPVGRLREQRKLERAMDARPARRDGPLRSENLSDEEIREIEAIGVRVLPGGLVNVSGVVTGCPCEDGANCSDQVWIVVYRPDQSKGLQLSGRWSIGPVQQWWLDFESLSARRPRPSADAYNAEMIALNDRFPVCSGPPANQKAVSTQPVGK